MSGRGRALGQKRKEPEPLPIAVPLEDVWAQCDNPTCQKWRRLPPGTVVNEDAQWFCYMNPDPARNRCDLPEEGCVHTGFKPHQAYDDHEEVQLVEPKPEPVQEQVAKRPRRARGAVLGSILKGDDYEEALEAELKDLSQQKNKGKGRGGIRWGSNSVHILDDDTGEQNAARMAPARLQKAQQGLGRLLSSVGSWSGGSFVRTSVPPDTSPRTAAAAAVGLQSGQWSVAPAWLWEALQQLAPAAAEVACRAADITSASKYFERYQGNGGLELSREAAALARLSVTAAAGGAIQSISSVAPPKKSRGAHGGKNSGGHSASRPASMPSLASSLQSSGAGPSGALAPEARDLAGPSQLPGPDQPLFVSLGGFKQEAVSYPGPLPPLAIPGQLPGQSVSVLPTYPGGPPGSLPPGQLPHLAAATSAGQLHLAHMLAAQQAALGSVPSQLAPQLGPQLPQGGPGPGGSAAVLPPLGPPTSAPPAFAGALGVQLTAQQTAGGLVGPSIALQQPTGPGPPASTGGPVGGSSASGLQSSGQAHDAADVDHVLSNGACNGHARNTSAAAGVPSKQLEPVALAGPIMQQNA